MECPICSESLTAFMDAELSPEEENELKAHLDQCSPCRQEYESLLYSYQITDHLTDLEMNPALWGRIGSQIGGAPSEGASWIHRIVPTLAARWVPVTAGTLSLAVLSIFLFNEPATIHQRSFRAFLAERERMELFHNTALEDKQKETTEVLYSNPFTVHSHTSQDNPFALAE